MSVWMLDDSLHKRLMDIIVAVGSPLLSHHAATSKALRSVGDTSDWFKGVAKGEFLKHIEQIMFSLEDATVLGRAGFLLQGGALERATEHDEDLDDEFAQTMAKLALTLASNRLRRGLG